MDEQRDHQAIKAATHEAVVEVLLALGVDISDPHAIRQMQKDMHWLRRGRTASENMPQTMRKAGFTVLAMVAAYMLWDWVQHSIPYFKGNL